MYSYGGDCLSFSRIELCDHRRECLVCLLLLRNINVQPWSNDPTFHPTFRPTSFDHLVGSPNIVNFDVGRNLTEVKMLAADVQQFYCFEVLSEMLDRLTTSADIVGSAHAQLAKERQNSIIASSLFS